MTPTGFGILFICVIGPIMPPLIGLVVGTAVDAFRRRKHESLDVQARQRLQLKLETE